MNALKKNRIFIVALLTVFAVISAILGLSATGKNAVFAEETLETFDMEDGVSAKLSGGGGIRFRVRADETLKEYLENNNYTLQFVVAPDYYFTKSVDYAVEKGLKIQADNEKIYVENGKAYANGCITDIKDENISINFQAIARVLSGDTVIKTTAVNSNARNNIRDVLTFAVLDASGDYEKTVFALSAYKWFGSEQYPVTIASNDEYSALKAKMQTSAEAFNGKHYEVGKSVTEYSESDFAIVGGNVIKKDGVTLNLNGGAASELTEYVRGTGATLPTPAKTGYTFRGWFEDENFTGNAVTEIAASDSGDKTYYAKWAVNFTAPTAKTGLVYNGAEQELVIAGSVGAGKVMYKLSGGEYGEALPTAVSAGEYTVYYKAVDGETELVAENSFTAVIEKATKDEAGVAYEYATGGYYVTGYSGNSEVVTVLGAFNDGANGEAAVTYVGKQAFANKTMKKVILPASVTDLGGAVFMNCANLEYVDMRGVKDIRYANGNRPDGANTSNNNFLNCNKLKVVIVGDGYNAETQQFVTQTPSFTPVLEMFVYGSTTASLNGNDKLVKTVYYSGDGEKCATWKFDDNGEIVKGAASHNLVNGVCTNCGERNSMGVTYAYSSVTGSYYVAGYTGSYETVTVFSVWDDGEHGEKSVTYVGKQAFANKTMKKVILPASVTDLGGEVFMNCANLEYVDARGVSNIQYANDGRPDGANTSNNNFRLCRKLTTVIIGDGFSSNVGQFNGDGYKLIDLYVYGTTTITTNGSDDALTGNIYYLGDGVKCATWKFDDNGEIVKGAASHNFVDGVCANCDERNAMGVTYAYSSATDSYYVAGYTGSYETVTVFSVWDDGTNGEKPVTFVKFNAFSGNTVIKKVIFPESVTTLDGCVFFNCTNLEYVEMKGVANLTKTTLGESNRSGVYDFNDFTWRNFEGCVKLTAIVVGKSFTVDKRMFHSDSVSDTVKIYTTALNAEEFTLSVDNTDSANNNAMLSSTVYYYSESESTGCWYFVDGVPALW